MKALAWWLIPAVAFVVAVAWVSFKNRPRPPVDTHDSMAEHLRFQRAMARQTEAHPSPRPPSSDDEFGDEGEDPLPPLPQTPNTPPNPFSTD